MNSDVFYSEDHHTVATDDWYQRPKRRLPKSSVKVLQRWLAAHLHHPYPNASEREVLEIQSGLNTSQISNWFTNARRRGQTKSASSSDLSSSLPVVAAMSVPNLSSSSAWDEMDPLARWRNSPPDEEHVPRSILENAVHNSSLIPMSQNFATRTSDLYESSNFEGLRALSDTSLESLNSRTDGFSSGHSSTSADSAASFQIPRTQSIHHLHRRRRKRKSSKDQQTLLINPVSKQSQHKRIYQCTFCTDRFKNKYDWTRHESSLHLTLEKWVCMPCGSVYESNTGFPCCVFCNEPNPAESHLLFHRYKPCEDKPLQARTFFRKDHFVQHIRILHGVENIQQCMYSWRTKTVQINCRCGFCGESFQNWNDRNEHLADHFRAGAEMKDWKGCRGLDPAVALHVQNAMPPYLIGIESNEFEPFSAMKSSSQWDGHVDQMQVRQPTRFEDLTAHLAHYVRSTIASGVTVTDETVRKEARVFMYGDDDAWNQTPADNKEWLRLFKTGLNLQATSECKPSNQKGHNVTNSSHLQKQYMNIQDDYAVPQEQGIQAVNYNLFPGEDLYSINVSQLHQQRTGIPTGTAELPWEWQTPECLAEFEEMRLNSSGNMPSCSNMATSDPAFWALPYNAWEETSGIKPDSNTTDDSIAQDTYESLYLDGMLDHFAETR